MSDITKIILPFLKLLIKAKVFIPTLLLAGLGAGVWFDKVTGDTAAIIGGLVIVVFLLISWLRSKQFKQDGGL